MLQSVPGHLQDLDNNDNNDHDGVSDGRDLLAGVAAALVWLARADLAEVLDVLRQLRVDLLQTEDPLQYPSFLLVNDLIC